MARIELAELGARKEIGDGGQGKVYSVPYQLDGSPVVYKEYRRDVLERVDVRVLERLVDTRLEQLRGCAAWPLALVEDQGRVTGFLMPEAPPDYRVQLRLLQGRMEARLAEVQHLLNDDQMLSSRATPIHDRWRLEFLRDTARTLTALHAAGIVVGDLSPRNLLFSFTTTPACYFIDCDAMQIDGETVLEQVETAGWEVPAGEQRATAAADAYKFALLAVRLFAGDQDHRDPGVLDRVSRQLRELASAGLATQPMLRPAPAVWLPALEAAMAGAQTTLPWEQPTQPVPAAVPPTGAISYGPAPAVPGQGHPAQAQQPLVGASYAPGRRRPRWLVPALVAALCLGGPFVAVKGVPLAVALVAPSPQPVVPTQSPDPVPRPTGRNESGPSEGERQAAAVQAILVDSNRDKVALGEALTQIENCRNLDTAIDSLVDVGQGRAREQQQAENLQTDALPQGTRLAAELASAMNYSYRADQAFIAWGRQVRATGCSNASINGSSHRAKGTAESKLAQAAKKRFIALWLPIAVEYGYPQITSDGM